MSAPAECLVQLHATITATKRARVTWRVLVSLPAGLDGRGAGRSLRAASMRALDDALRLWSAEREVRS